MKGFLLVLQVFRLVQLVVLCHFLEVVVETDNIASVLALVCLFLSLWFVLKLSSSLDAAPFSGRNARAPFPVLQSPFNFAPSAPFSVGMNFGPAFGEFALPPLSPVVILSVFLSFV
jgi:hypothetical protein